MFIYPLKIYVYLYFFNYIYIFSYFFFEQTKIEYILTRPQPRLQHKKCEKNTGKVTQESNEQNDKAN